MNVNAIVSVLTRLHLYDAALSFMRLPDAHPAEVKGAFDSYDRAKSVAGEFWTRRVR